MDIHVIFFVYELSLFYSNIVFGQSLTVLFDMKIFIGHHHPMVKLLIFARWRSMQTVIDFSIVEN